jgi:hypothetical protein
MEIAANSYDYDMRFTSQSSKLKFDEITSSNLKNEIQTMCKQQPNDMMALTANVQHVTSQTIFGLFLKTRIDNVNGNSSFCVCDMKIFSSIQI